MFTSDVITLSKVEVSAALGLQRQAGVHQTGGVGAPFDGLAAGGTPGVFTHHQQLIRRACKST